MKRGCRGSLFSAYFTPLVAILVYEEGVVVFRGQWLLARPSVTFFLFLIIFLGLQLLAIVGALLNWSTSLLKAFFVRGLDLTYLNGATDDPFLRFPSLLLIIPLLSWLLREQVLLPDGLYLGLMKAYWSLA